MIEEYGAVILIVVATVLMIVMLPLFASRISEVSPANVVPTNYMDEVNKPRVSKYLSIDGKVYEYEEGMSWNQWISSSYNEDRYSVYLNPCTGEDYLGRVTITHTNDDETSGNQLDPIYDPIYPEEGV